MLDKMYDDIGGKLKKYAKFVAVVGMVIGLLWFMISMFSYVENAEYIEYAYEDGQPSLQALALEAVAAKQGMIYSLLLIASSIISSWPLYGLGQLIQNSDIIRKHLTGSTSQEVSSDNYSSSELPNI